MQEYLVTLSILVLLYEFYTLIMATRMGKKVGSKEAIKHTFIRSSTLMIAMSVLLLVYQYLKLNFLQNVSLTVELLGLFAIVIFLAIKTEGYFARRPLYYEKGDHALILTSVKNPIDLTRVSGVTVNGARIEVEQVGRPSRNIHLADEKVRKEIVRKLRIAIKKNKGN